MASFSRMTAALASATNELTVAAANFNFDFSVMKVEAPSEFQPLGRELSDRRRDEAENGVPHVTAQKLGALFKDVPPATPNLIKAYGTRVSEIAQRPLPLNLGLYGMNSAFAGHAGRDGTSIWAAATSGPGALSIQLLACMLARLWNGSEATSVWVELVRERKLEIERDCEEGKSMDFGTLMATRQIISRSQLSEWDASARAWLRSADEAKKLEQTNLMLIIDNLDVPVNYDMRVYPSVIEAWKTALKSLECMILGMPQSLNEQGAVLVGLSAWHLYPDLLVLAGLEKAKEVVMLDSLIPKGGVLTIGLQRETVSDPKGIYWSLSLAHLRYYGEPVLIERNLAHDSSRISFEQLLQVAFGSISFCWGAKCDPMEVAELFTALGEFVDRVNKAEGSSSREKLACALFLRDRPHWLKTLIKTARIITGSSGLERDTILRLLNVGSKHGTAFLVTNVFDPHVDSVFGLCNLHNLLPLLRGSEARIRALRRLASKYNFSHEDVIIRYERNPKDPDRSEVMRADVQPSWWESREKEYAWMDAQSPIVLQEELFDSPLDHLEQSIPPQSSHTWYQDIDSHFEYASAVRVIRCSLKRELTGQERVDFIHQRWLKKDDVSNNNFGSKIMNISGGTGGCREGSCLCIGQNTPCTNVCGSFPVPKTLQNCGNTQTDKPLPSRLNELRRSGEECFVLKDEDFAAFSRTWGSRPIDSTDFRANKEHFLSIGDIKTAAILVREDSTIVPELRNQTNPGTMDIGDLIYILRHDGIMVDRLLEYLNTYMLKSQRTNVKPPNLGGHEKSYGFHKSLYALSVADQVYRQLPGATVDIKVIQKPIFAWKWWGETPKEISTGYGVQFQFTDNRNMLLDRERTFSCVAAFETGNCDISPKLLTGAMALSSGDSMFVAAPLLCDPLITPFEHGLQRIVGNVGRPGITILVPPSNLLTRKSTPENWNIISHVPYDGRVEDNFKGTTLHLSFTDYNPPVVLGLHGARDAEAFILESIVSVHDRGKWVADLDILKILDKLHRCESESCQHGVGELPTKAFASIDSWEEFLDLPVRSIGIARAHKNWVARLSLVATSLSQTVNTFLCPEKVCWKCLETQLPDPSDSSSVVVVH